MSIWFLPGYSINILTFSQFLSSILVNKNQITIYLYFIKKFITANAANPIVMQIMFMSIAKMFSSVIILLLKYVNLTTILSDRIIHKYFNIMLNFYYLCFKVAALKTRKS